MIDGGSELTTLTAGRVGLRMPNLCINVPGEAIMTTSSIDCAALVGRKLGPHSLRITTAGHDFRSKFTTLEVGDCSIVELNYEGTVEIDAGVMESAYLVTLCLSGAAETRNGAERAVSGPGTIIVASPGKPTRYALAEESRNITVRIPRRKLEARACELFYYDVTRSIEFNLESSVSGAFGGAFAQQIQHICAVAATAPSALKCVRIASDYANILVDTLLNLHTHNYSDQPLDRNIADVPKHLQCAIKFIETNLQEIVCIQQIADAVGVSDRCLQKSFRRYLRSSPAEFLRERRLHRFRKNLLTVDRRGGNILDLMLSVGINQSGRYSGYYQQRFGESPSETRRRAHSTVDLNDSITSRRDPSPP